MHMEHPASQQEVLTAERVLALVVGRDGDVHVGQWGSQSPAMVEISSGTGWSARVYEGVAGSYWARRGRVLGLVQPCVQHYSQMCYS